MTVKKHVRQANATLLLRIDDAERKGLGPVFVEVHARDALVKFGLVMRAIEGCVWTTTKGREKADEIRNGVVTEVP